MGHSGAELGAGQDDKKGEGRGREGQTRDRRDRGHLGKQEGYRALRL